MMSGPSKNAVGTYVPFEKAAAGHVSWKHRGSHFIIFGATTLMLILPARTPKGRAIGLAAGLSFGVGIELAQYLLFIPGIEWWDIRDDTIASFAAYVLAGNPKVRTLLIRDQDHSNRATTVIL